MPFHYHLNFLPLQFFYARAVLFADYMYFLLPFVLVSLINLQISGNETFNTKSDSTTFALNQTVNQQLST
jgi:hypothetical protein